MQTKNQTKRMNHPSISGSKYTKRYANELAAKNPVETDKKPQLPSEKNYNTDSSVKILKILLILFK